MKYIFSEGGDFMRIIAIALLAITFYAHGSDITRSEYIGEKSVQGDQIDSCSPLPGLML